MCSDCKFFLQDSNYNYRCFLYVRSEVHIKNKSADYYQKKLLLGLDYTKFNKNNDCRGFFDKNKKIKFRDKFKNKSFDDECITVSQDEFIKIIRDCVDLNDWFTSIQNL